MEKAITTKIVPAEDNEKLRQMYIKVVGSNQIYLKEGYITCPECGEEILVVPALKKMNQAIENHVYQHKMQAAPNLLVKYTKPICIRLALAQQILLKL
jgi:uncharacterized protein with PIN domain